MGHMVDQTSCKMRRCNKCDEYRKQAEHATEQWIPVSERLPDEGQKVWVTKEYPSDGHRITEPSVFRNKDFYVIDYPDVTCTNLVKAWCARVVPEPYKK